MNFPECLDVVNLNTFEAPPRRVDQHRYAVVGLKALTTNRFASVDSNSSVIIWDSHSIVSVMTVQSTSIPQVVTAISDDIIAIPSAERFYIYECKSPEPLLLARKEHAHSGEILAVTMLSHTRRLVTSGRDGAVRVWALKERPAESGGAFALLAAIPRKLRGTEKKHTTWRLSMIAELRAHSAPVNAALSVGQDSIASVSDDGFVLLWVVRVNRCEQKMN